MEENENNVQNQNEQNANQNNNGSKKVTISLMVIILILVLGIGVGAGLLLNNNGKSEKNEIQNNTNQTQNNTHNNEAVNEKEMYESLINEYKKTIEKFDINTFNFDENSIVNTEEISFLFRNENGNPQLGYTFYDIDNNGTKEMVTGIYYKDDNSFIPASIYGYNSNSKKAVKIYHLDTLDRGNVGVYTNGIIHSAGSAGAAVHIAEFGKIGSDGYSYEQLELVEEEYEGEGTNPNYKNLINNEKLEYKSWDEMTEKYLKNSNEIKFTNIEAIDVEIKKQNQATTTEDLKITKEIIASGWAGSSMHRVRLYSNGEAYYITYNGAGETEDCIISKVLVAKNVDEISEKQGEHGEFVGVIVKGKNINVIEEKATDWIFFEKENNNTNANINSEYNTAVAEIKKCLKDDSWIANNVMMKSSVFNEPIKGKHKVTFMKVVNGNYSPMFVIQDYAEEDLSSQLFIVTYQNGKVVVNEMKKQHISHGGSSVDPNKAVIGTGYIHMGYYSDATYSIKTGKPELLVCIGQEPIDTYGEKVKYYKQIGNGQKVDITEQEYKKIQDEEKNKYKFYPVGTDLTDANVDEYVK